MASTLNINGNDVAIEAGENTPLLWVLRDELQLTGTKYGCGIAQCGACVVHLDGQAIRSCVTPASALIGQKITTIEGLQSRVGLAVQRAWQDLAVAQCGYCQSGQIMAATALLDANKAPTDAEIDAAMTGNLCRCATYGRIRTAIKAAASALA